MSPDATEQYFASVKSERSGNTTATDDDRDGKINEDDADDLDGNGKITWMRVKSQTGRYKLNTDDPRSLILADAAKGETGTYALFSEGIDKIKVKGKDEALTIYEPLGMEAEVQKDKLDELKLWQQTLRSYRSQQWDQVELQLLNLQRINPACYLYKLYAERVAEWRKAPPPADWDGVTAFDEK